MISSEFICETVLRYLLAFGLCPKKPQKKYCTNDRTKMQEFTETHAILGGRYPNSIRIIPVTQGLFGCIPGLLIMVSGNKFPEHGGCKQTYTYDLYIV